MSQLAIVSLSVWHLMNCKSPHCAYYLKPMVMDNLDYLGLNNCLEGFSPCKHKLVYCLLCNSQHEEFDSDIFIGVVHKNGTAEVCVFVYFI